MKKILLLAALAAGALGAQAEGFDDLFKVQVYHGMGSNIVVQDKVYENGSSIEAPGYYDMGYAYDQVTGMYIADLDLMVTNISDEPWQLAYGFKNVSPTVEEAAADFTYGSFSICHDFYNVPGATGNCLTLKSGEMHYEDVDIDPESALELQLHQNIFMNLAPYKVCICVQVYEGGEPLEGYEYEVYIDFTHQNDIYAAVGAIGSDSAAAEYYNLQGVRVANPEHGLFIKKQGGKASKVIL